MAAQRGGGDLIDVPHLEGVEPLRGQDLGVVATERIAGSLMTRIGPPGPSPGGNAVAVPAGDPTAASVSTNVSSSDRTRSSHLLGASRRMRMRVVAPVAGRVTGAGRGDHSQRARADEPAPRGPRRRERDPTGLAAGQLELLPRQRGAAPAQPQIDTAEALGPRTAGAQARRAGGAIRAPGAAAPARAAPSDRRRRGSLGGGAVPPPPAASRRPAARRRPGRRRPPSRLPLSSTARLRTVTWPLAAGVHV